MNTDVKSVVIHDGIGFCPVWMVRGKFLVNQLFEFVAFETKPSDKFFREFAKIYPHLLEHCYLTLAGGPSSPLYLCNIADARQLISAAINRLGKRFVDAGGEDYEYERGLESILKRLQEARDNEHLACVCGKLDDVIEALEENEDLKQKLKRRRRDLATIIEFIAPTKDDAEEDAPEREEAPQEELARAAFDEPPAPKKKRVVLNGVEDDLVFPSDD